MVPKGSAKSVGGVDADSIWQAIRDEVKRESDDERLLTSFFYSTVLNHDRQGDALELVGQVEAQRILQPIESVGVEEEQETIHQVRIHPKHPRQGPDRLYVFRRPVQERVHERVLVPLAERREVSRRPALVRVRERALENDVALVHCGGQDVQREPAAAIAAQDLPREASPAAVVGKIRPMDAF